MAQLAPGLARDWIDHVGEVANAEETGQREAIERIAVELAVRCNSSWKCRTSISRLAQTARLTVAQTEAALLWLLERELLVLHGPGVYSLEFGPGPPEPLLPIPGIDTSRTRGGKEIGT